MDKLTQSYRLTEISKLDNKNFDYQPSIKLFGGYDGSTKCMSITKDEFIRICQILTEEKIKTERRK